MMKAVPAIAFAATLATGVAAFAAAPAAAQERPDPDWPCVQRKVPELSVAGVWSGPPAEAALQRWQEDAAVAEAVAQLASRRVPVEEATASVAKFAQGLKPTEKAERLTLLFAGVFDLLNRERSEIIGGIERYARGQKAMAEQIRADQSRLSDLNASGDPQASALTTQLQTQVRVFNERSHSLTYVCEVPTLIEQRLFSLARAIQSEIPS